MTAKGECPKCGAELTVVFITEKHTVHNGIGMQTVAQDSWAEISDISCEHRIEDFTKEEYEEVIEEAGERAAARDRDYADRMYDELKDEGKL